jgi:hypothetical protein
MKQGRRSISLVRFPDNRRKKTLALCEGTHQVTHLQVNLDLRQENVQAGRKRIREMKGGGEDTTDHDEVERTQRLRVNSELFHVRISRETRTNRALCPRTVRNHGGHSCGMGRDIHMHTCIGSHRDQDFEGWGYRYRCVTRIGSSRAIFRARAHSQSPR